MANDTTTAPNGAMPDGVDPQGVTPTTPVTGETPETTTTPPSLEAAQKELADLKAALKRANEEAKNHRLKANELDKLKAEIEASKLSETERLQKQYDELKTQHEAVTEAHLANTIKYEVQLQAASLGVNPKHLDKVARFIEWDDIEVDDQTGNPTNIRTMVEQLIKDMPELLSKGTQVPTSGGATNPPRSQSTTPQALSWSVISKMKPDEYDARRAEIQRWMLDNPPRYR